MICKHITNFSLTAFPICMVSIDLDDLYSIKIHSNLHKTYRSLENTMFMNAFYILYSAS